MGFVQQIRSDRIKKRNKRPFRQPLFHKISGIVKKFGLDEEFLWILGNFTEKSLKENMDPYRLRGKIISEIPPFSMVTEEDYGVTMGIMERVGNPYLYFVQSPDEILLCGILFKRNPDIRPERLKHFHFETLLQCERAKEHLCELTKRIEEMSEASNAMVKDKDPGIKVLQGRIKELRDFITKVETI